MLNRIHSTHLGVIKCKERAKDILFRPGMGRQIEETVATCEKCQEHQMSNAKEPMTMGELPSRPWQIVATDLFHFKGCHYLLIVDYYSCFFETVKLPDNTAKTVICHTKSIFARHGIPNVLRSDNGPQFTSDEFKQFSSQQGFSHISVSPYHPQANGLAEKYVQIIKRLLIKASETKSDPYLSLLEYQNTTINNLASPAQLLMSRHLRSVLPATPNQLTPKIIEPSQVIEQLEKKQRIHKKYYDQGSRPLSELKPNDPVYMQAGNRWIPATVIQKANTPHSYIIKTTEGCTYRRNRQHLKTSRTQGQRSAHNELTISIDKLNDTIMTSPAGLSQPVTSNGRPVETPTRFQDYVKL